MIRTEEKPHRNSGGRGASENRASERVPLSESVRFAPRSMGRGGRASSVTDISRTGLGLRTRETLEPGASVELFIERHYDVYKARGTVVWVKNSSPMLSWLLENRAGVRFEYADQRLIRLYGLMAGSEAPAEPEESKAGPCEGPLVAEKCRNHGCGKTLFMRKPEVEKGSWTICSDDPPPLQSTGSDLFYRCPHCRARNRIYSDYANRRITIAGIIPE